MAQKVNNLVVLLSWTPSHPHGKKTQVLTAHESWSPERIHEVTQIKKGMLGMTDLGTSTLSAVFCVNFCTFFDVFNDFLVKEMQKSRSY